MFELKNFKPLDIKSVPLPLRDMESSSLVLIKPSGFVVFGRTKLDKDNLKKLVEDGDLILFAWHGKYRTDIFTVTKEDFDARYMAADGKPRKEGIVGMDF